MESEIKSVNVTINEKNEERHLSEGWKDEARQSTNSDSLSYESKTKRPKERGTNENNSLTKIVNKNKKKEKKKVKNNTKMKFVFYRQHNNHTKTRY